MSVLESEMVVEADPGFVKNESKYELEDNLYDELDDGEELNIEDFDEEVKADYGHFNMEDRYIFVI